MYVILVRLPSYTTYSDIGEFLEPVLKRGIFGRKGVIENIEIQILYDPQMNTKEYHGVIRISPDSAAERVIRKLDRKKLNGKHITVREFHLRNWHNDKRESGQRLKKYLTERRNIDRRRKLQKVERETIAFSSNKQFHRTF